MELIKFVPIASMLYNKNESIKSKSLYSGSYTE